MNEELLPCLEALIFASDQPLVISDMQKMTSVFLDRQISEDAISETLHLLVEKYTTDSFAFHLVESGGGFQFLTKADFHKLIASLNGEKFTRKLSATSMETLSIIAYKQPVTKTEIEFIRGVGSDYSIQKLLEKELIYIQGRKEDAIGKPLLYGTTKYFMDYLGINDVSELPQLKEIIQNDQVMPTEGKAAVPQTIIVEK